MKVFLVSNIYPSKDHPDYGVFVKNFRTSLEELGVKFPNPSLLLGRSKGIQKIGSYFFHYLRIFKTYFKNDFDIIYIHFISHNAPIFYGILWLFAKKAPIVVNVHGSDVISYNHGLYRFFNTYLLKKTDLVVVPSNYFLNQVFQKFPFLEMDKIFINPSGGIDLDRFYPMNTLQKDETLTLGFVSRIDDGKGWGDFIKVVARIKRKGINVKGIMVGTGSQVKEMLAQIKDETVSEEIHYAGVVDQKKLVHLYNQMDIFIFPSTREAESLGLVGLEAMACGIPIIAFNKAGAKTYTQDGENGFLCTPGNIDEIEQKVILFNNLKQFEKDKIKINAIDTANKFGKGSTAEKMLKRLKTLESL